MSETNETLGTQPGGENQARKRQGETHPAVAPVVSVLRNVEGVIRKDCDEIKGTVNELRKELKDHQQETQSSLRQVQDTVKSRTKLVEDRVGGVGEDLAKIRPGWTQGVLPIVSAVLLVGLGLGIVFVAAKIPPATAVAEEVKFALSEEKAQGGGPRQNTKEINELHAKVDRITEFLRVAKLVTKPDLDQAQKDILNKVTTGASSGNLGKDVKELSSKLEGIEKSLSTLQKGIPTQIRDELLPIRNAVDKGQPDAKALEEKLAKLTVSMEKAIKSATDEQTKKLAAMEARLSQLSEAMRVPREDQLVPVLFILEAGSRMLDHNHESARAAMLQALNESVRQTPARTFGLLVARGKDVARPLRLSKHDPTEIADILSKQEPLVPNANNEVAWEAACTQAVTDMLNMPQPRKRIVYVTCSPPTEGKIDAAKFAGLAAPKGVEIWVIHLTRSGDAPSRDLAALATETGGAYIVVQSLREDSVRQKQANRRLESALFDALDLRAPETANK